jgi:hypothetical protein
MTANWTRGAPRHNKMWQRHAEARQEGEGGQDAGQHGNQPNKDNTTTNQTRWVQWSNERWTRQLKDSGRRR